MRASQRKDFDVEYLRIEIRACLSCEPVVRSTMRSDMHTNRVREPLNLRRPSATYEAEELLPGGGVKVVRRRKPQHAQWTTTLQASSTKSRKPVEQAPEGVALNRKGRVLAIWLLTSLQICSILARYSSSEKQRTASANRLATRVARDFTSEKVKRRARIMAVAILFGGKSEDIRDLFDLTDAEWRYSQMRKTYYKVLRQLDEWDVSALKAWEKVCAQKGMAV